MWYKEKWYIQQYNCHYKHDHYNYHNQHHDPHNQDNHFSKLFRFSSILAMVISMLKILVIIKVTLAVADSSSLLY